MTGSVLFLIGLSLTVLALYFAWWRMRARVYLVRSLSEDTPNLKYLGMARSAKELLFDGLTLHRTAQQMRHRYEVDTRDVDAVKTIEATLRSGGLPHYIYRKQLVLPEYLVLIDKHEAGDHHSRFLDEILRRLEASDVAITRYYFSKDPRTCFAGGLYGMPDTLAHLAQVHDKKRLLVFWDGSRLIDPASGSLQEWKDLFGAWEHRFLFAPGAEWQSERRKELFSEVFSLYDSSPAGFQEFAGRAGKPPAEAAEAQQSIIRELISVAPERWLSRNAPEQSAIDGLVNGLKRGLGEKGFFWLCACAVYPELRFELTVFLGQSLQGDSTQPLLDPDRFAGLSSLPWFRNNYMPDWLRLRLISELSRRQRRSIRGSIGKLLLKALQERTTDFELEVAEPEREAASALFRRLLKRHLRKAPENSILRDYVFVRTWTGWWNPLALPLPSTLRAFWKDAVAAWPMPGDRRRGLEMMIMMQIMMTWAAIADDAVLHWLARASHSGPLAVIWLGLMCLGVSVFFHSRLIAARCFGFVSAVVPTVEVLNAVQLSGRPPALLCVVMALVTSLVGFGILQFLDEASRFSSGKLVRELDPYLGSDK